MIPVKSIIATNLLNIFPYDFIQDKSTLVMVKANCCIATSVGQNES